MTNFTTTRSVISETQISFTNSPVSGHNHDGSTSALIDTSKYSIFDFSPSMTDTYDPVINSRQQRNSDSLKSFIVNVVKNSLETAIIEQGSGASSQEVRNMKNILIMEINP